MNVIWHYDVLVNVEFALVAVGEEGREEEFRDTNALK
jgi:hypothetical protein